MPPPYIGLFIKGSEFKEILITCTEPTSLLHEKTTRDNPRQFRMEITKVLEFKEILEFTLTPNPFPTQKNCTRPPRAVLGRNITKKIKPCQAFFLFFP